LYIVISDTNKLAVISMYNKTSCVIVITTDITYLWINLRPQMPHKDKINKERYSVYVVRTFLKHNTRSLTNKISNLLLRVIVPCTLSYVLCQRLGPYTLSYTSVFAQIPMIFGLLSRNISLHCAIKISCILNHHIARTE